MNKLVALLLSMLCIFCLVGCASNDIKVGTTFEGETNTYEGVSMVVVENSINSKGATIEILNTTKQEISSGNQYDFSLQIKRDDAWYELKEQQELVNTSEAFIYEKDQPVQQELNWKNRYGSLPAGHYRIVKRFFRYTGTGTTTEFIESAEFVLD